jgi:hypothetical protein
MARERQCKYLPLGEYNGSAMWRSGSGIEERLRCAEGIGIEITELWVCVHLKDGEEIVRFNRKTNRSAQIYLNMSLRDALKEQIINGVTHSSNCCRGQFGFQRQGGGKRCPCGLHTPEWLEAQVDSRLENIVTDEEWPAVLAQHEVDAAVAQGREDAKAAGSGEWYRFDRHWCISIAGRNAGEIVPVRRRDGTVSLYQLGKKVSEKLYMPGPEVRDADESAPVHSSIGGSQTP